MKITLPEYAEKILDRLESMGCEASIVGGCVRDSLLGRTPGDFDITTSATPDKIMEIFASDGFSAVPTGIAHGTVTVVRDGKGVEVTTYRIDGEYTDHRRPERVTFTPSLAEDLKRRDFTVNAMAYSKKSGLVDLHGGTSDLEQGLIRTVGSPEKRFSEDALRILRAVRFCSVLDFRMDADTEAAAFEMAYLLEKISPERISAELSKMLTGKASARVMRDYFEIIAPFFGLSEAVRDETAKLFAALDGEAALPVRLAALCLHEGEARDILRALRFDGKTAARAEAIIENRSADIADYISAKHLCRRVGTDTARDIALLQYAKGELSRDALGYFDEIAKSGECVSLKGLALTGRDLTALGYSGEDVGRILDRLLTGVIENRIKNDTASLTDAVHRYKEPKK